MPHAASKGEGVGESWCHFLPRFSGVKYTAARCRDRRDRRSQSRTDRRRPTLPPPPLPFPSSRTAAPTNMGGIHQSRRWKKQQKSPPQRTPIKLLTLIELEKKLYGTSWRNPYLAARKRATFFPDSGRQICHAGEEERERERRGSKKKTAREEGRLGRRVKNPLRENGREENGSRRFVLI